MATPRASLRPFVEIARPTAAPAATFEIALTNGRVVRVASAFEEAALRRLLAIVEASGDGADNDGAGLADGTATSSSMAWRRGGSAAC